MSAAIEILSNELASLQRRVAANDLDVITARHACESRVSEVEANTEALRPRIAELEAAVASLTAPAADPAPQSDLLARLAKPESVRDLLDAIEAATGYDYERLTHAIVDARDLAEPVAEPAPEPKRASKRPSKAPVSLVTGPEQPVVDASAETDK